MLGTLAAEETGLRGDGDTKSQGFNWSSKQDNAAGKVPERGRKGAHWY